MRLALMLSVAAVLVGAPVAAADGVALVVFATGESYHAYPVLAGGTWTLAANFAAGGGTPGSDVTTHPEQESALVAQLAGDALATALNRGPVGEGGSTHAAGFQVQASDAGLDVFCYASEEDGAPTVTCPIVDLPP